MIEIEDKDLFNPPEGTTAIVIPCAGEVGDNATMGMGYALQAKHKWPPLARALGYFILKFGVRTCPLTYEDDNGKIGIQGGDEIRLKYHIIGFPTRKLEKTPLEPDLIVQSARRLRNLATELAPLREGKIVKPALYDPQHKVEWAKIKVAVGDLLADDRFVILTNNGTPT
jgi:hypothetical protein